MTQIAPFYSGKVRDIYDAGAGRLLMVASDRISAFDVVMEEPVPDKGRVLTGLTVFWLEHMASVAPSHLLSVDPADYPPELASLPDIAGRSMLVRRAEMLPIECVVRGYLSGSAWKEYRQSGTVNGIPLPAGLDESAQLPEPLFTPSTKATTGHDENITFEQAVELVGDRAVTTQAAEISLEVYSRAAERVAARGLILADTKFELGFIDGRLSLCDEVLTPDSSRFWDAGAYRPGTTPPSFDKQPVRDWLETTGWDKKPPPPPLPDEVVASTRDRYVRAYEIITGQSFDAWPPVNHAMRFPVMVEVRLRPDVADPQGSTIERALPALGFAGVRGVRVGKCIRFEIEAAGAGDARRQVEELCRRFLTNPVIEDAEIEIGVPADQPAGTPAR